MSKHGKKYIESQNKFDRLTLYSPEDAVALVKEVSYAKFDATIEAHLNLGIDPRKADQQVRGTVALPNGTGKNVRVLVLAESVGQKNALEAGADYVGLDDLIEKIQGGWFEFDATIATTLVMRKVGRLGRLLGPRGLMPSPKAGTVVPEEDVGRAVGELKGGRVEFRLDRTSNIHVTIGKSSFTKEALYQNFSALMEAIVTARPSAAKGQYIHSITLAPTMGAGIKVDQVRASQLRTS